MAEAVPALSSFHDIVEAAPVSWWPLQAGWWILGGVLLALGLRWGYRRWQTVCANAYRREALALLESAESVAEVAQLLKRGARVWVSAETLAGMTDSDWIEFLESSGGRPIPEPVAAHWSRSVYRGMPSGDLQIWKSFARDWFLTHQAGDRP